MVTETISSLFVQLYRPHQPPMCVHRCCSPHSSARDRVFPSFTLDAGRLDNGPPFLGLGLMEGVKRFRRLLVTREYLLADGGEPLAYRRIGKRVDHRAVEFHNDLLRRALGDPQPVL